MKKDWYSLPTRPTEELIASFGAARLLKHPDGKFEIRGGTAQDKADAHAWMHQFLLPPPPTPPPSDR